MKIPCFVAITREVDILRTTFLDVYTTSFSSVAFHAQCRFDCHVSWTVYERLVMITIEVFWIIAYELIVFQSHDIEHHFVYHLSDVFQVLIQFVEFLRILDNGISCEFGRFRL